MTTSPKRQWRAIVHVFAGNADGAIAILFALLAVPIIGIALTALDYNRADGMKAKLQTAVDNAAFAASRQLGEPFEDVDLTVRSYLQANLSSDLKGLPYNITIASENSAITLTMKGKVPTTLLSFVGVRNLDVAVASTVKRPSPIDAVSKPANEPSGHQISPKDLQKKFGLDHEPTEIEMHGFESKLKEIIGQMEQQGEVPPELQRLLGELQ